MPTAGQKILTTRKKNKIINISIGKQGRDLGRIDEPNQVF